MTVNYLLHSLSAVKRVVWFIAIVVVAGGLTSGPPNAAKAGRGSGGSPCSTDISGLTDTQLGDPGNGYDIFETDPVRERVGFGLEPSDKGGCRVLVTMTSIDDNGAQRYLENTRGELRYRLYMSTSARNVLPNGTEINAREGLVGSVNPGRREAMNVYAVVPAGQRVPAGTYTDRLRVDVFNLTGGARRLIAQKAVTVRLHVETRASINLAATDGGFPQGTYTYKIDFGRLESGEERRVYVQVRSASHYRISMKSRNAGSMSRRYADQAEIPYKAFFSGRQIDLSDGWTRVHDGHGPTPVTGKAFPLRFRIGDVRQALAGRYHDQIFLEITPTR